MSSELPDMESAIIGCCLLDPLNAIPQCQGIITGEEWFQKLPNQMLWHRISNDPSKADLVSLCSEFEGLEMNLHVHHCMDVAEGLILQLPAWLEELQQAHTRRRLITVCQQIIEKAGANDPAAIDFAEREILAIRPNRIDSESMKQLVLKAVDRLEFMAVNQGKTSGLSTSLRDLDTKTDGLHPGECVVIAGFPSTGKTALALNICTHNALNGIPVAFFSAEMSPTQLAVRALCSESKSNHRRLVEADIRKIALVASRMAKAEIFVEKASGTSIGQINAMARRLRANNGIRLMVVDYLQLITGTGDNREQEISSVSKGLKSIAMELDIPVIALSQLNDDGKLRESRAIGQDADSVWKLENDGEWRNEIQPIKLNIAKSRDGETGTVKLIFFKTFTRFEDAAKEL